MNYQGVYVGPMQYEVRDIRTEEVIATCTYSQDAERIATALNGDVVKQAFELGRKCGNSYGATGYCGGYEGKLLKLLEAV